MADSFEQCVLVGGCPRSGTSWLVDALARGGLDIGSRVMKSRADAPQTRPITEDLKFTMLNTYLLEVNDQDRFRAEVGQPIAEVTEDDRSMLLEDKESPWVMKDPHGVSLMWPTWRRAFPGVRMVSALRHPASVMKSAVRFFGMSSDRALKMWWRNNLALLGWTEIYPKDSIRLVHFPTGTGLYECCRELGLDFSKASEGYKHDFVRADHEPFASCYEPLLHLYRRLQDRVVAADEDLL